MPIPVIPIRSVAIAEWGDRPRRIRTGILMRLLPPTRVPKKLLPRPTKKIINSFRTSIVYRYELRQVPDG
jgi:hypothetical protein